jgi:hypothetical protein
MESAPLLRALFRGPRGIARDVVDPYKEEIPGLDRPGGARQRRKNLAAYLEQVGTPRLVLLGEALGFRGGRFSGIAFTSERQLAGDDRRLAWAGPPFAATSLNPVLWIEPSGSVVWGALGGDARGVLLWNSFPWHPFGPRGPLSNRTPERGLWAGNLQVLERLLAATAGARFLAVGRTAAAALAELGVEAPLLRHPPHRGAEIFRGQVREHLARHAESMTMQS